MEVMIRRRTRLHEEEAAEVEKSISSIKPSRRIRLKKTGQEKESGQASEAVNDEGVGIGWNAWSFL